MVRSSRLANVIQNDIHADLAGYLTGGLSPHAVASHKNPVARIITEIIFVIRANAAHVGFTRNLNPKRHVGFSAVRNPKLRLYFHSGNYPTAGATPGCRPLSGYPLPPLSRSQYLKDLGANIPWDIPDRSQMKSRLFAIITTCWD